MNNKFVTDNIILKENGIFKIYYEGDNEKQIDENKIRDNCFKYFNNIDVKQNIVKLVGDLRTLFRDIIEEKFTISYSDKNTCSYKITFENKQLVKYEKKIFDGDVEFNFYYQNKEIFYNIVHNDLAINFYNNRFINFYSERLKEVNSLQKIDINRLDNEILYINEIYNTFYGKYPDYSEEKTRQKIQVMMYILSEYGVKFIDNYQFSNDNKIPTCKKIDDLIDNVIPYISIKNKVELDAETVERINIIKKSIKNSTWKSISYEDAILYLGMVLYESKHNLKLGYTFEDVINGLNCPKTVAETGLRLYKKLNKQVYKKS